MAQLKKRRERVNPAFLHHFVLLGPSVCVAAPTTHTLTHSTSSNDGLFWKHPHPHIQSS